MKVTKRYNQHRRDLYIDTECENCGTTDTIKDAYDDSDYWNKWQPQQTCPSCGFSTDSMGKVPVDTNTKYAAGQEV